MKPMVLACVLLCLAGCARGPKPTALEAGDAALGELRAAVVREVKDPQRAKQAIGLVDEAEKLLAVADADLRAHNARIHALNSDYDSTQEAWRAAFRDFNAKQDERQNKVLDLNQRGKLLLTLEEWTTLRRVREEALERVIQAGREG